MEYLPTKSVSVERVIPSRFITSKDNIQNGIHITILGALHHYSLVHPQRYPSPGLKYKESLRRTLSNSLLVIDLCDVYLAINKHASSIVVWT